jgi:hypothetical protein
MKIRRKTYLMMRVSQYCAARREFGARKNHFALNLFAFASSGVN